MVPAVLAAAVLGAPPVAAQAAAVRVTLRRVPARAVITAVAVRVSDGTVAAARSWRGRTGKLALPAGTYLVAGQALNPSAVAYTGTSHAFVARGGTRGVVVSLARSPVRGARGRATSSAAPVPPGSLVTVGNVTLAPEAGSKLRQAIPISGQLTNLLFNHWQPQGVHFIDSSAQVVSALNREQQLSNQGRTETAFQYHPLVAQYAVQGSATAAKGGVVTIDLKVVSASSGDVVASIHTTARQRRRESLQSVVDRALADAASGLAVPASPPADSAPPSQAPPPAPADSTVHYRVDECIYATGAGTVNVTVRSYDGSSQQAMTHSTENKKGPEGCVTGLSPATVTLTTTPDAGYHFSYWDALGPCPQASPDQARQPTCSFTTNGPLKGADDGDFAPDSQGTAAANRGAALYSR